MFQLAVCAEMVFRKLPFVERVRRIAEMGFQVEIWDWTKHDIDALLDTGAATVAQFVVWMFNRREPPLGEQELRSRTS